MAQQKRSARLGLVLELISRKEETERAALGELQAGIKQAEMKVQELVNYQRQYQAELLEQGNKIPTGRHIQNYHVFISRLGVAVEQQQQQLLLLRQRFEAQRQQWQLVHQKKTNMSDLVERCRLDERKAEDKQQQRDIDDTVYRRALYRSKS
jgi:flagellar protein FliJ